jgi:guanine nucleotide-binding protein subunit beta-2-like 1 protein
MILPPAGSASRRFQRLFVEKILPSKMASFELGVPEFLRAHRDEVKALKAVSTKDMSMLYSASKDRKVFAWDLKSTIDSEFGKVYKAYEGGHQKRINGLEVSKVGDMMVTVSSDRTGRIWDTGTKEATMLEGHSRDVICVSVNYDDTKIVTGSVDGFINLYNTQGQLISSIKPGSKSAHRGWINCLEFQPVNGSSLVASGSSDGTVKIWNVETQEHMETYIDGTYVDYRAAEEKKTKIYDYDEGKSVTALAFSKDGSLLAYGGKNSRMYLIKLDTKECYQSFDTGLPVRAMAAGETYPIIAVSTDENVFVWDIIDSRVSAKYSLKTVGSSVSCLSLAFSGSVLYCGLSNGEILSIELRRQD